MTNHRKQLEENYGLPRNNFANGSLKLNEISEPILGLIFEICR